MRLGLIGMSCIVKPCRGIRGHKMISKNSVRSNGIDLVEFAFKNDCVCVCVFAGSKMKVSAAQQQA